MVNPVINILNILSVCFLSGTILLLFFNRTRSFERELNNFYLYSFLILLLVAFTNLLEHFSISDYFDEYEDSLELLFIPFIIFALYSTRLQKELKLRERAENFTSKILSTSPAFTFIYNLKKRRFTFLSGDSLLTGYTLPEELVNAEPTDTVFTFITGEKREKLETHYRNYSEGMYSQFPVINEMDINLGERGTRLYQSYETVFTSDGDGNPIEIVGVAIDITEKKQAENKLLDYKNELEKLVKSRTADLERSNQELVKKQAELQATLAKLHSMQNQLIQSEKLSALGVLMAGIAHEINNPVNYISNGILGLKKALVQIENFVNALPESEKSSYHKEPVKVKRLLESHNVPDQLKAISVISSHIQSGVNRIIEIVGSLRQYTRSGNEEYRIASIHEIIESVLVMLQHEYKNRIDIVKKFDDIPGIECQPGKINQVLMNILSNAIQAIEGKGIIEICSAYLKHADRIVIRIIDDGPGMHEDILSKIFDPFYTTKQEGMGTGLGLSISYDIIQSHGGEILVKSAPGKGSEFTIELPRKRIK